MPCPFTAGGAVPFRAESSVGTADLPLSPQADSALLAAARGRPVVLTDLSARPFDAQGIEKIAGILAGSCDALLAGEHQNTPDFRPALMTSTQRGRAGAAPAGWRPAPPDRRARPRCPASGRRGQVQLPAEPAWPRVIGPEEFGVRPVLAEPMQGACRAASQLFGLPTVAAAGQHLPFADGSFDAALILGVLSALSDKLPALAELRRVLVPAGQLGLLVYLRFSP
ncbi:MAG: class I SAM-dependent methyltransferase [Streptosporangiaceae bacterium]